MKTIGKMWLVLMLTICLMGCSVQKDSVTDTEQETTAEKMPELEELTTTENVEAMNDTDTAETYSQIPGVDYDLTAMSKDMVYATIYQVMYEPDKYEGKVFRIQGPYYPLYVEETGKYYHYCLIQDAAACCTQGMEFVWDDGSHIYPDEYPAENTEVEVQGTFDIYTEDTDSKIVYFRLNQATLEW